MAGYDVQVVTLDFSLIAQYESVHEFEKKFYGLVFGSFKSLGFNPVESDPSIALFGLAHWLLKEQPINSIVLLIDEYDSLLPAVRQQKVGYESVGRLLRSFYAMLKFCDSAFRFIFITGETPFNTTNIFESFNSLQDISSSANYATVLGFTKVELVENFQPCLSLTAAHHHLSLEELLERMREYNDAGSATQQIYSPQSV